jgi:hypothetical protein
VIKYRVFDPLVDLVVSKLGVGDVGLFGVMCYLHEIG